MIKVIDNFLKPGYYNELEGMLYSHLFEWGYQSDKYGGIFSHGITDNGRVDSSHAQFLHPMLLDINDAAGGAGVVKARFDMTMQNSGTHGPHVDQFNPHIAGVMYFGEFDGGTEIYNEKDDGGGDMPSEFNIDQSIEAKGNRLILFSGNTYHSGVKPVVSDRRIILNVNMILPEQSKFYYEFKN
jgi:hypothetical protein